MAWLSVEEREKRDAAFAELMLSFTPEAALRKEMIAARVRAGLSQRELAALMRTSHSVIARLEVGERSPNLKTLRRLAEKTGSRLVVRLEQSEVSRPR